MYQVLESGRRQQERQTVRPWEGADSLIVRLAGALSDVEHLLRECFVPERVGCAGTEGSLGIGEDALWRRPRASAMNQREPMWTHVSPNDLGVETLDRRVGGELLKVGVFHAVTGISERESGGVGAKLLDRIAEGK